MYHRSFVQQQYPITTQVNQVRNKKLNINGNQFYTIQAIRKYDTIEATRFISLYWVLLL